MKGPKPVLIAILELVCDPQGPSPGAVRWVSRHHVDFPTYHKSTRSWVTGSRIFNTHIYECKAYPFGLIGPATIMWRPVNSQTGDQVQCRFTQKDKRTIVEGQKTVSSEADNNQSRTLWLRFHPLIFDGVTRELRKATSEILARPSWSIGETEVEIADIREQVNAFEIMGPKSSQVLRGALTAVNADDRADFKVVRTSFYRGVDMFDFIDSSSVLVIFIQDSNTRFDPSGYSNRVHCN